jgi:isopentenyl-diphosphate delta-isomerase
MEERVILVDAMNNGIGTMEKMEVHRKGLLHRAFSIFIFDSEGKMLIHRRAAEKYHCAGLWTNACCSHPRPNEILQDELKRRLLHEMGFYTELSKAFDFTYRSDLGNGMIEYEYDEVFMGNYSGEVNPNPREVGAWRFEAVETIRSEILLNPESFTPWFRMLFDPITKHHSRLQRA